MFLSFWRFRKSKSWQTARDQIKALVVRTFLGLLTNFTARYIYIYVVCLQWNDESKALVPLYLILKCLRVECVMETHLTVGAVAFCIGWTTRALQSDSICSPCQCLCQCNCACESSLGVGTILILLIGVGILGGLATLWYHRVYLSQTTSPTSAKGRKGVFGTQGKVLTLTG